MTNIEFLKAVIAYIEEGEMERESEWGSDRSLDELKAAGEIPPLYAEAKKRLEEVLRV